MHPNLNSPCWACHIHQPFTPNHSPLVPYPRLDILCLARNPNPLQKFLALPNPHQNLYWFVFEYLSRIFGLFDMSLLNPSLRDIPHLLGTVIFVHYHIHIVLNFIIWLLALFCALFLNTSSSNYTTSECLKRDAPF
ncbi:hypothetical protein CPB86DRAFT_230590 [Serendipita vermifera]|nr:hypothetical protein CPB86DRAFT_230590 [Serendipita vermifera]